VQKRQSSQQRHLVLLGPTSVKAARKTLVKLPPGVIRQIQLSLFHVETHSWSFGHALDIDGFT